MRAWSSSSSRRTFTPWSASLRRRLRLAPAFAAAAAALATACGPTCREIARAQAAVGADRAPAPGAHAAIYLPFAEANRLIAETLPDAPPVPVDVPGLGVLEPVIGRVDIAATAVRLRPRAPAGVAATVELSLRVGGRGVLAFVAEATLEPRLVDDGGATWIHLGFGADNITTVRPELPMDAIAAVADFIHSVLPEHIQLTTPRIAVRAAAVAIINRALDDAFGVVRDTLLVRLGELTAFRVRLPAVPIDAVTLTARDGLLAVELHTTLPVRAGLRDIPVTVAGDRALVRVAGSALAELGNWAMAGELIPARFDAELRPAPDGAYRVALDWSEDATRPLDLHVFRTTGRCSHVLARARPAADLAAAGVDLELRDRVIARVRGSELVRLWVWARENLTRAARRSWQSATTTRVTLGPATLDARVVAMDLTTELAIELTLRIPPPP